MTDEGSISTKPGNEAARLSELYLLDILDTEPDANLDRYTHLLSEFFKVPIAAICLIDDDRQWLKSSVGAVALETPLEESFCVHALHHDMLEIPNTLKDDFFHDYPSVVGYPFIRFYMGCVLHGPTGQPIGTLCIMDTHSRYLSREQRSWLATFGHLVEELINNNFATVVALHDAVKGNQRDPDTGLPNEASFIDNLTHLLRMAKKNGNYLAIVHMRLNRMEEIGRGYGRRARDAILHCLANRLTASDIKILATGHLDRADFSAVIPMHSPRDFFSVISPIVQNISMPIELGRTTVRPDIDIGISVYPNDGQIPEDLLDRAKASLDGPKTLTGVHVFSREHEKVALRKHTIEQQLEPALLNNRLTKHYQPLVTAEGGRIVGFEALARWEDQKLGKVSPGEFVRIAEKNSRLSRLLTEWSLRTVCRKNRFWPTFFTDGPFRIAVNIPAAQFYQKGFVDRVLRTLYEHQMDPCNLTLELTEESLLANTDMAIMTMRALRSHGIALALDDFGTGYSSLSYLKDLPLDTLKIDKSFIDGLFLNSKSFNLVKDIIRLAHGLNLQVVAEGVEEEQQRALLQEFGCDVIQGYLFSRPLADDDAIAYLDNWQLVS